MKAIILAGGRGERLIPLTNDIPKPMIKIGGMPVIERQVAALKKSGVTEIIVCGHYKFDAIKKYFGAEWNGVKITYVDEPEPLGTGGAVKNAAGHIDEDDFIVFNGDIVTNIDMREIVKFHISRKSLCTLVMRNTDHPKDSNVFEMDGSGKIINFIGKGQEGIRTAHTGFFVLNRRILDMIPKGRCDMEKDVVASVYRNENVMGFVTSSYTRDMGTPDRLKSIEEDFKSGVIR